MPDNKPKYARAIEAGLETPPAGWVLTKEGFERLYVALLLTETVKCVASLSSSGRPLLKVPGWLASKLAKRAKCMKSSSSGPCIMLSRMMLREIVASAKCGLPLNEDEVNFLVEYASCRTKDGVAIHCTRPMMS